jgi:hypothetical protein
MTVIGDHRSPVPAGSVPNARSLFYDLARQQRGLTRPSCPGVHLRVRGMHILLPDTIDAP